MIHYHGTPITPREELWKLAGRHFCVSFADHRDVQVCHEIGQSVMLDNGAYTAWTQGRKPDWEAWANWVEPWLDYKTTWAVLPDVIDGDEFANDHLASQYAWLTSATAPVWHLHESLERLKRLCAEYERVCFGSSGVYAKVGSVGWHHRVSAAFDTIAEPSGRVPWIHMLRGMSLAGSDYPFSSVDSVNAARNFKGSHKQAARPIGLMVAEMDARQNPGRWHRVEQLALGGANTMTRLESATTELVRVYGHDPSLVGAEDGSEDDYGDMLCLAVELLGRPQETLADEAWQHVQDVAMGAQVTTMNGWAGVVEAALNATEEAIA